MPAALPEAPALRTAAVVACLALAACSSAETERPTPPAPGAAAPEAGASTGASTGTGAAPAGLPAALAALDVALLRHLDPALTWEMDAAVEAARDALAAACDAAPQDESCAAARVALDTLAAWHSVTTGMATMDAAQQTALEQALLTSLGAVEGVLPQTGMMAATIELESGRVDEGVRRLLALWQQDGPAGAGYAPTHALVRSFRDVLPDPKALEAPLRREGADPYRNDLAPATAGLLRLAAGLAASARDDRSAATAAYEAGAADLAAAVGRDPLATEWDLIGWRADCLVNAGWLHVQSAEQELGAQSMEGARAYLEAAEADFFAAYELLPDDADARAGIAQTGDLYYQAGDLPGIREYFGRAARRFDDAEWWNNHAFFCRETEEYERSYEAYVRCIELAPDDARWVNDTGLILLYHLQRDLDRAEELFRRAWELGKKAAENPFASEDVVQENVLAYTDAMLNLGQLCLMQGRLDEAQQLVDELLAIAPDRPDARMLAQAIARARSSGAEDDAVPAADPEG